MTKFKTIFYLFIFQWWKRVRKIAPWTFTPAEGVEIKEYAGAPFRTGVKDSGTRDQVCYSEHPL